MSAVDGERIGLRERRKRETRTALSWATIRLTVERGFDNVLVEDIAAAAGVSPRTFNNYFSSKGEAIVARHLDRCRAVVEQLRLRPADEPLWEAITQSVLARLAVDPVTVQLPVPDQDSWAAGVQLMVTEPAVRSEMARVGVLAETELAVAIAERTGTDVTRDLYPSLVATAVLAAVNTAMRHWLRDQSVPIAGLLTTTLDLLAAGLPTP